MRHFIFLSIIITIIGCNKSDSTVANTTDSTTKTDSTTFEQDIKQLDSLLVNISKLTYSTKCTDSTNWKVTAVGAKACGGPSGYVAYSTNIDTAIFLNLVKEYTVFNESLNKKWGLISDCSIARKPSKLTCKNDSIKLVY